MSRSASFVPISQVCDVIDPHPSHRAPERMSKGIPFVGIGDFDFDGKLQIEKARVVSRSFLSEHAGRYSLGDDLLAIGRVASIGKVVRLPKATDPYLISPTLAVLRPHSVDISYLFFALQAPNFQTQLEALSRGSTRRSVGIIDLRKASIPLPSPAEQQRIVDILGRAFGGTATAKANAEKNLQNSRALFESHLQSVFTQAGKGWVERRLWEVFEIGSSKRIRETEWTSAGVPFYGGKEIVRLAKFGSAVSAAYISEEKYRDYASKYDMPRKGDILITARGTIGVGYVVKEGDKFYYKDGNIISFREKTPTNALFVLYAFRSKTLVDQFADLTGATVKHLPIERAKDLVLKMPTFATQNSVVEHLENIEKEAQRLESIYQRKLAVLEALKKSLLHQAFAGKL